MLYLLLASLAVALHAGFVVFVLFGGLALHRFAWVAWLHVPAMLYAILIQTVGWACPLTDAEKWFRSLAGQRPYAGEFLPHYLWSPLGLTGAELVIGLGLIALLLAINLRPYLRWWRAGAGPRGGGKMRSRGIRLICALAFGWLVACGPVPGGALRGQPANVPADWKTALGDDEKRFCEIEARPEDPHSIQLECFLYEGSLYVNSHRWAQASWWPVASWAVVWLEHPNVQVRIGDQLYPLVATPVTDLPLREQILRFRGYDPVPPGIVVFRFDPRTA